MKLHLMMVDVPDHGFVIEVSFKRSNTSVFGEGAWSNELIGTAFECEIVGTIGEPTVEGETIPETDWRDIDEGRGPRYGELVFISEINGDESWIGLDLGTCDFAHPVRITSPPVEADGT